MTAGNRAFEDCFTIGYCGFSPETYCMNQFEYVMVLISIIVGLGVAHLLLGISGIIDRLMRGKEPMELSLAHAAWLGCVFGWLVMFWWWEYRFSTRVANWTLGLYFFLVLYAVVLFLLSAILVPRTWDGVDSLKDYFLRRRAWFYGLYMSASAIDLVDSYLKGGLDYFRDSVGMAPLSFTLLSFPIGMIGIKTCNMTFHNWFGVFFMIGQYSLGFGLLYTLRI